MNWKIDSNYPVENKSFIMLSMKIMHPHFTGVIMENPPQALPFDILDVIHKHMVGRQTAPQLC